MLALAPKERSEHTAMPHVHPPLSVLPPESQQLLLPLTPQATPTRITPQQVWSSLTRRQQEHLFHQLVTTCCNLITPSLTQPVDKEVPHDPA